MGKDAVHVGERIVVERMCDLYGGAGFVRVETLGTSQLIEASG